MTPAERKAWFPGGQSARSEQEVALGESSWIALDRIRSGMDPITGANISTERQEHLMRTYLPERKST